MPYTIMVQYQIYFSSSRGVLPNISRSSLYLIKSLCSCKNTLLDGRHIIRMSSAMCVKIHAVYWGQLRLQL